MSQEYSGRDPMEIAREAERDLNSYQAKQGLNNDSLTATTESGVNEPPQSKFPGSTVTYGSAASGSGDNREIPVEEGGDVLPSGRVTKARDFEGEGGPEDKARLRAEENPGSDEVRGNIH